MNQTLDRILSRVNKEPNGCWIWQGATNKAGYGQIKTGSRRDGTRRQEGVHRVAYVVAFGPVPHGYQVHHTCYEKACVNPDHLEVRSPRANVLDPDPRNRAPAALNAKKKVCPRCQGEYVSREWGRGVVRLCLPCQAAATRRHRMIATGEKL